MLPASQESSVLAAFSNAARRVPAYAALLREAGIEAEHVRGLADFQKLPVLRKSNTFQRFNIEELCVDGSIGDLSSVLTSSGHSGVFAFGLTETGAAAANIDWVDDSLDYLFSVRSRRTLLINCLPMGVKVSTRVCTLGETSVRPDMALGLIRSFGRHYRQIIILGDPAFAKHLLEMGPAAGVDWRRHTVHLILGEETLAENARSYFSQLLGHDAAHPEKGMIISSMGIAELGLNLFFEAPPVGPLVALRRLLHQNRDLRQAVLGPTTWVPSLFTYDPRRIFVEFDDDDRLLVTTLDPAVRIPLIRYAPGDKGALIALNQEITRELGRRGFDWPATIPVVVMRGRDEFVRAGEKRVYPEAVKEGIYQQGSLAAVTTANFRLLSEGDSALVRIQLARGIAPRDETTGEFRSAITAYVDAPIKVCCERYEEFGSGMALDYERKFQYIG